MSASPNGTRLAALDGQPSEEDVFDAQRKAQQFETSLDEKDGIYYTLTAQGKYLTTGKSGAEALR